jgi:hydroxyethylthiazole kinase-like sugar kinase family protein
MAAKGEPEARDFLGAGCLVGAAIAMVVAFAVFAIVALVRLWRLA